jgi:hypothetical protein
MGIGVGKAVDLECRSWQQTLLARDDIGNDAS